MMISHQLPRWLALTLLYGLTSAALADTVLITGANSGIGLEFARQYAVDGWHVIATHRRDSIPESLADLTSRYDNVQVETIDVTDPTMIEAAAKKLEGVPIDILINNAGIVGTYEDPAQKFSTLDYDLLHQFIDVNLAGPLRMSEAFYDNVVASKQKKIVAITSGWGSLTVSAGDGRARWGVSMRYWYAISKAALNMGFIGLSKDTADDGVSVAVYQPGLVRVARTERYALSDLVKSRMVEVDDSVSALRQRFAELGPDTSGSFFNYRGEVVPW